MNVIVVNEKKNDLSNINIDVIKRIEGCYSVEELIGMFSNFFFNKLFIDVTSIKDYSDYNKLKKLFTEIDVNKTILVLNDFLIENKEFISDIISLGIYNFARNFTDAMVLYNNPRSYAEVSNLHIKKTVYDINEELDKEKGLIKDEFTFESFTSPEDYDGASKKIIGVCNITEHAGATTLVAQMIKQLNLKYKVIGIEMNNLDFVYFNIPFIYSCTSVPEVLRKIKDHSDIDAVIVDLNNVDASEFCTDVIYLVEPGILRLGKMLKKNPKLFENYSGKKIVLNRTNIKENEITEFEVESNCKIFCAVSNFRDTIERVYSVDKLLHKLGFTKCLDENPNDNNATPQKSVNKKGLFGKFF